jgi:hypothetical protein
LGDTTVQPAPSIATDRPAQSEATPESAPSLSSRAAGGRDFEPLTVEWTETLITALQSQWRPPAELDAPLRYALTLEPTGEIRAVEPLTALSRRYQNNPTLPQVGRIIPNLVRNQAVTVEVEFSPAGTVQIYPSPREIQPQE